MNALMIARQADASERLLSIMNSWVEDRAREKIYEQRSRRSGIDN